MSISHSIKELFTIKDKNIDINSFQETIHKNKKAIVNEGDLVRTFRHCPFCKESAKQIVKNGKKISMVLFNRSGNKQIYLRLRKQRYHCRACGKYFTAHTYLVAPSCFISKQVHYTILEELTVYFQSLVNLKRLISIIKSCLVLITRNNQLLRKMPKEVPSELHYIKKAFFRYKKGIQLAFSKKYSNAKLENLHTHIKTLKRIAYGFRSFTNMRLRIFLINGLISYT